MYRRVDSAPTYHRGADSTVTYESSLCACAQKDWHCHARVPPARSPSRAHVAACGSVSPIRASCCYCSRKQVVSAPLHPPMPQDPKQRASTARASTQTIVFVIHWFGISVYAMDLSRFITTGTYKLACDCVSCRNEITVVRTERFLLAFGGLLIWVRADVAYVFMCSCTSRYFHPLTMLFTVSGDAHPVFASLRAQLRTGSRTAPRTAWPGAVSAGIFAHLRSILYVCCGSAW